MTVTIRLLGSILDTVRRDFARRHPFAAERVGFLYSRIGNAGGSELLSIPFEYAPIGDDEYIDDPRFGATFGASVHRRNLQRALQDKLGVIHVHQHHHAGTPGFSTVDLETIHAAIPSLKAVSPTEVHGAILLSNDRLNALLWLPGHAAPAKSARLAIVARPIRFFFREGVQ